MEVVTVQFDEVHNTRRVTSRTAPRCTVFSFGSGGQYTTGVVIPGFPRLESGMRVRALLRKAGNWATLVGWRDLDTGELAAPDEAWHVMRIIGSVIWGAIALGLTWPFGANPRAPWVATFLFVAVALVFGAFEYRGLRRVQRDVQALKQLLPAAAATR